MPFHPATQGSIVTATPQKRIAFTVLGDRFLRDPRILRCLKSWQNLPKDMQVHVMDDGTLTSESTRIAESELGFSIVSNEILQQIKSESLSELPTLRHFLKKIPHFSKAVYTPFLAKGFHRCLVLDSDVFFLRPIEFCPYSPDILFCRDDVPGYRITWNSVFKFPLLDCINAGFNYFRPESLSVSALECFLADSRTNSQNNWWIEQASWSFYGGNAITKGLFSGIDARTISGLGKRTVKQILDNEFVWYRRTNPVPCDEVRKSIDDASVVHFAGPGKPHIDLITPSMVEPGSGDSRTLRWEPIENVHGFGKGMLAARLAALRLQEIATGLYRKR